ncbi:Os10g0344800, partial [Oryza sativa Japonica Group]
SSDLKRAAETAEIIEKACDVSNLVLTESLRERHMGYLQGLTWDDTVNKSPGVFKGFANFEVKNGLYFDGRNQELPSRSTLYINIQIKKPKEDSKSLRCGPNSGF